MLSQIPYRWIAVPYNNSIKKSSHVLIGFNAIFHSTSPSRFHSRIESPCSSFIRYASTSQPSHQLDSQKSSQRPSIKASPSSPPNSPRQHIVTLASLRETLNPPATTLPPTLQTVSRTPAQSTISYYYHLGRSYASFYKDGVRNAWTNYKSARDIRRRIKRNDSPILSRSERLLLKRSSHDVRRIPPFAVLFLIFGEWVPLLVPFVPHLVPLTCRIPRQEEGMRQRQATRMRQALRALGNPEWPDTLGDALRSSSRLENGRVVPWSQILGLYSPKFDWLVSALPAVSSMSLSGRLNKHLNFLRTDDQELLEMGEKAGGLEQVLAALTKEERIRACEDRGLDMFEKREEEVRWMLGHYLGNNARESK